MQDYRKLRVWADAHELAKMVYRATGAFPSEERFGMTSQIRRAAVSVPSNIVEGAGRRSPADFRRFLDIAAASSNEVQHVAMLARDLGWMTGDEQRAIDRKTIAIRRQLHALGNAVDTTPHNPQTENNRRPKTENR